MLINANEFSHELLSHVDNNLADDDNQLFLPFIDVNYLLQVNPHDITEQLVRKPSGNHSTRETYSMRLRLQPIVFVVCDSVKKSGCLEYSSTGNKFRLRLVEEKPQKGIPLCRFSECCPELLSPRLFSSASLQDATNYAL